MVREVSHECVIGNRVGGKIVNMIRHADDKAVVASSHKGLQELMNRLNASKIKVCLLTVDQQVEQ